MSLLRHVVTNQVHDLRDAIRKAITSQRFKSITPLSSLLAAEHAIG